MEDKTNFVRKKINASGSIYCIMKLSNGGVWTRNAACMNGEERCPAYEWLS